MITRKLKTIINRKEKVRKYSTCSNKEPHIYDELYGGQCTYENTMEVPPEGEQKSIQISHTDTSEIKETIHEINNKILDELLKNEFKIYPERDSDSE